MSISRRCFLSSRSEASRNIPSTIMVAPAKINSQTYRVSINILRYKFPTLLTSNSFRRRLLAYFLCLKSLPGYSLRLTLMDIFIACPSLVAGLSVLLDLHLCALRRICPDGCGLYFVSSFSADLRWSAQAWSVGIVGFQSNGFEVTLPSILISNSTVSISPIILLNLPGGMAFQFSGMLLYFGFSRVIPIRSPLPSTGVSGNSRPDLFFCSDVSITVSVSTGVSLDDI